MSIPVHHVAGRLRVRVPEVKSCPAEAAALQSTLRAVHGVTRVECRPVTGSVIVQYVPGAADIGSVLKILACNPVPAVTQAREAGASLSTAIRNRLMRAALSFALEKAAERALVALIAAML